ncbi:hypothetical protein [Aequorivita marina]|uniref:hypothetical protein n=1 Tax=Aequorivita marina TaxID=3073654 RepID=UPI0028751B11|nr:hypothetical protein [Aequorivita sp. S2608]MDS1299181.1 hypothetical protein [Aequorivita sp. S2608]
MIKKCIFLLCLLMLSIGAVAQDLMVKSDGEEIEVKVLEITPDNIKFKKQSNIDGPLYIVNKSEVKEIIFENGDKEVFPTTFKAVDSRKAIFVKTTADSKTAPSQDLWKAEIERHSSLRKVNKEEEADLIFEFRLRRAMGEARVSVVVYDSNNKELWKSKRYRGTTNVFNRMSPTFHGIRKCMDKGVIREMEKGTF